MNLGFGFRRLGEDFLNCCVGWEQCGWNVELSHTALFCLLYMGRRDSHSSGHVMSKGSTWLRVFRFPKPDTLCILLLSWGKCSSFPNPPAKDPRLMVVVWKAWD